MQSLPQFIQDNFSEDVIHQYKLGLTYGDKFHSGAPFARHVF